MGDYRAGAHGVDCLRKARATVHAWAVDGAVCGKAGAAVINELMSDIAAMCGFVWTVIISLPGAFYDGINHSRIGLKNGAPCAAKYIHDGAFSKPDVSDALDRGPRVKFRWAGPGSWRGLDDDIAHTVSKHGRARAVFGDAADHDLFIAGGGVR